MKQLIVRRHGLAAEGAAFTDEPDPDWPPRQWWRGQWWWVNCGGVSGVGRGLCSCGAASDALPSAAARKAWHRKHKADIYYGEESNP